MQIQDLIQCIWRKIWPIRNTVLIAIHIIMQQRFKEYFGNKIIQTEIRLMNVTFRNKAREVLYDFYSQCDLDPEKINLNCC